jgi:hypothetical protein
MMFTNLRFHVQVQLSCYEGCPDAYQALCHVLASKEFQYTLQKKTNFGYKSEKHTFGAMDMSVCLN